MKKTTLNLLSVLLIMLFSSNIISAAEPIQGKYSTKGGFETIEIVLNDNGTYFMKRYNEHWYSQGSYSTNGKVVSIDSDIQKLVFPYEVEIKPKGDRTSTVNIHLITEATNPKEYICSPYRGDYIPIYYHPDRGSYSFEMDDSINGVIFKFEKAPFRKKWLGMMPELYQEVRTEPIQADSERGDEINIKIFVKDDLFRYMVYNNFQIKVKKNKLIFKDPVYNDKVVLYKVVSESD